MIRYRVRLTRDGTETFKNKILNIPTMRERFVEKSSHLILAEARLNAPIRSGELRDSGEIRRTTRSAQTTTDTITFSRVAPGPGYIFDVAKWTHDPEEFPRDGYTPSSPDP